VFRTVFGLVGYFQQQRDLHGCFPDLRTPEEKAKGKKGQCDKVEKGSPPRCPKWNDSTGGVYTSKNNPCRRSDPGDPPNSQQPPGCSPHMLYQFLCPAQAAQAEKKEVEEAAGKNNGKVGKDWNAWWFHSEYDPGIKTYLQSKPPEKDETRGDALLNAWGKKEELTKSLLFYTGKTDVRKLSISAPWSPA
jgi:hypothetical protein